MKKHFVVIIGIFAVLMLVSSAMAFVVPGQKTLNYVPIYQDGIIVAYIAETPGLTLVPVSDTRINYVDSQGKVKLYKQTVMQGPVPSEVSPIPQEVISSPYPADWDQNVMKFTYLEYMDYCQKNGIPKKGTFAINLPSGAWMK